MKNSVGSYKIRGVLELLRVYKSKSTAKPRPQVGDNTGFGNMQLVGLRFVNATSSSQSSGIMGNEVKPPMPSPKPPSPPPPRPPPPGRDRIPMWVKLVLGSVFSLLLAFFTPNWPTLLKIGGEAEVVIKEVEQVAEVVEKVAVVVEKVSDEVADNLPDGNKFKETTLIVEHVSKEAAKDAHIAQQILHKLDVVKHDFEDVEETIETIIDTIENEDKSNQALKS